MDRDVIELIGIVGSIASLIGLFLGFTICKKKYNVSSQKNSFFSLFNFGSTSQDIENKQQ